MRTEIIRDKSNSLDLRFATSENADSAKRFLVLSNGRSEWLEKYFSLPADLKVGADTAFLTFDHRGQGASGGARAWIDHYDTYAQDMASVIDKATGGKPYNLVCHSMGGLIGLYAIMKGLIKPRCVVLSSPLIGMPNTPLPAPAAYHLSNVLTKCYLGFINTGGAQYWKKSFEKNQQTHSAEKYKYIQNSPYPVPSATFAWVKASFEATQFISQPENQAKLTMPLLVLCGTDEEIVDAQALQRWAASATQNSKSDVEFHWIQDGLHELLFESKPIYEQVLSLIRGWFDKKGFPV